MLRAILASFALLTASSALALGSGFNVSNAAPCACCQDCKCESCACDALGCACDVGGPCACDSACCATCCSK